jgi:hypothetical protein
VDSDGDTFSLPPGGSDCDDARAETFPGAAEVQGNGIDEDCTGADLAATPVPQPAFTGQRAAAFKRCRKNRTGRAPKARHKCKRKAQRLPF